MRCIKCGSELDENTKFCPECGQIQEPVTCPACHADINPGAAFCTACGAKLSSTTSARKPKAPKTEAAQPQQPTIIINNTNASTNANVNSNRYNQMASPKSKWVAFFLCLFLGVFGVHRFYVGKTGTGFLWMFTLGFGVFGWFIDLLVIALGLFRDKNGLRLIF